MNGYKIVLSDGRSSETYPEEKIEEVSRAVETWKEDFPGLNKKYQPVVALEIEEENADQKMNG